MEEQCGSSFHCGWHTIRCSFGIVHWLTCESRWVPCSCNIKTITPQVASSLHIQGTQSRSETVGSWCGQANFLYEKVANILGIVMFSSDLGRCILKFCHIHPKLYLTLVSLLWLVKACKSGVLSLAASFPPCKVTRVSPVSPKCQFPSTFPGLTAVFPIALCPNLFHLSRPFRILWLSAHSL